MPKKVSLKRLRAASSSLCESLEKFKWFLGTQIDVCGSTVIVKAHQGKLSTKDWFDLTTAISKCGTGINVSICYYKPITVWVEVDGIDHFIGASPR